jgi:predicted RNase H-like HicB family nuclease
VDVEVNLMLLSFEEDGVYFVYSPELDLNGYGNTEEEARQSLDVVLRNFLEYAIQNDTLTTELVRHGWALSERLVPPSFNDLVSRNKELSERMLRRRPVLITEHIRLPAIA